MCIYLWLLYYKHISNIYFVNSKNNELLILFKNYIKHFTYKEAVIKTNNKLNHYTINNIVHFYLNNIITLTNYERKILYKHIQFIDNKCAKFKKIFNIPWNIIVLSNNIEKGMPFTLGHYIFLPKKYIDNLIKYKFNKDIFLNNCDTLLHEKIHILQRIFPIIFKQFYKIHLHCKYINNLVIDTHWKKKHFKNPDGLDIKWVYRYNNNDYLPMLIFNKNQLNQIIIKLTYNTNYFYTTSTYHNLYEFPIFKDYPTSISVYHPNEITAYIIPKLILNNYKLNNNLLIKFSILMNKL